MAKAETTTFTRGPLYASRNAVFAGKNCIGLADEEVIHRDEAAANARLWAVSPDLFAFVVEFLEWHEGPGRTDSPLAEDARRLLSRVEQRK